MFINSLVNLVTPVKVPRPRSVPPTIPTDKIVEMYPFDDDWFARNDALLLCFHYNAVLDPVKMKTALTDLINTGEYRKMGSRLRVNKRGKVENHVPATFDEKRLPFNFSHLDLSTTLAQEHPLGRQIPVATSTPTFQTSIEDLLPIICDLKGPHHLEDWLGSEKPVLSFHVTSFRDATLISFQWSHCVVDMIGFKGFLKAWMDMLNSRKEALPTVIGFDSDPCAVIGAKEPDTPAKVYLFDLKGWNMVKMLFASVYEDKLRGRLVTPNVCLPAEMVRALRTHALIEVREKHGPDAFVSENDIVAAICLKGYTADLSPKSNRSVTMLTPMGMRHRFKNIFPENSFFQGNAVFMASLNFKSQREIKAASIGDLAYALRQTLAEQGTKEELEKFGYAFRKGIVERNYVPILASTFPRFIIASSFSAAKFFEETDVSAALSTPENNSEPLLPALVLAHKFSKMPGSWNHRVLGKDAKGNFWVRLFLPAKTVKRVERAYQELHHEALVLDKQM